MQLHPFKSLEGELKAKKAPLEMLPQLRGLLEARSTSSMIDGADGASKTSQTQDVPHPCPRAKTILSQEL